mmetsp:Transcript_30909/g.74270  ORF Transcript_30909/g.74270 Transcript_30909/m.74270 type:complete len:85 (+) Transcript_30909:202-456(+)
MMQQSIRYWYDLSKTELREQPSSADTTVWYANVAFQRSLRVDMGNMSHSWKNDWVADMRDMRDSDILGNSMAGSAVAASKSAAR